MTLIVLIVGASKSITSYNLHYYYGNLKWKMATINNSYILCHGRVVFHE